MKVAIVGSRQYPRGGIPELSHMDLFWQVEAYFSYSSRRGALSFEDWMGTKDFTECDRQRLRVAFNEACSPERRQETA